MPNTCFAPGCNNPTEVEFCNPCLMNGGVKPEKKMFSKVIERGLTFGQAMDKCIHERKKVSREVWGGYWEAKQIKCFTQPIIKAVLKDNAGTAPATPYVADMFATDWMVVE